MHLVYPLLTINKCIGNVSTVIFGPIASCPLLVCASLKEVSVVHRAMKDSGLSTAL